MARENLTENAAQLKYLRDEFENKIGERISDIVFNGERDNRLPHISNISFRFVEGEGLLINLDMQGIAVSTGSACSSGSLEPSPVIVALGRNDELARGAIRFSFGKENTPEDLEYLLETLPKAVENLRPSVAAFSNSGQIENFCGKTITKILRIIKANFNKPNRRIYPMKPIFLILMTSLILSANAFSQNKIDYPQTKTVEQTDDYHGTKVSDPYRWLEDDNSAETKAWVQAENKVTFDYLNKIPQREQIKKRLTELWNYAKYSAPFKEGGKYFYYKNDGLQISVGVIRR